ncbi:hypothetical protein MKW98_007581 [Papaver atlanticum]|uniref:Uncharacterized protein n=1 Tax=Papaver atlanticum TaxID=357466 RepID=A0AAD4XHW0_9MAGN|nr:hypothetical protein MKW98_007581 [Papaver atlanticum]
MMEHLEWRTPLSGVPYQITKINLSYQDGKHGKAWGIVDKEGREVVLCGYIKENPFYICSEAGSRDIGLPENQEFFAIKHRHNRTKRMRRWKIRKAVQKSEELDNRRFELGTARNFVHKINYQEIKDQLQ